MISLLFYVPVCKVWSQHFKITVANCIMFIEIWPFCAPQLSLWCVWNRHVNKNTSKRAEKYVMLVLHFKALQTASFTECCTVPLDSHFIVMYNQFKINVKAEIKKVLFFFFLLLQPLARLLRVEVVWYWFIDPVCNRKGVDALDRRGKRIARGMLMVDFAILR